MEDTTEKTETITGGVAVRNENAPALTSEQTMINVIAKLASDPHTDVEKIERLLQVQITMMDRQAKIDYDQALARVQAKMPRITKLGQIKNNEGKVVATYARYEDIDEVIRPLLRSEGFSLKHTREHVDGRMVVTTFLKHASGHEESVSMPLPYDKPNNIKTELKAAVATYSVGKRVNVCSLLDIVGEGEDEKAARRRVLIDDNQAAEIKDALRDTGADVKRFLQYMGVDCVENISMDDYPKARNVLVRKIREVAKKEIENETLQS